MFTITDVLRLQSVTQHKHSDTCVRMRTSSAT